MKKLFLAIIVSVVLLHSHQTTNSTTTQSHHLAIKSPKETKRLCSSKEQMKTKKERKMDRIVVLENHHTALGFITGWLHYCMTFPFFLIPRLLYGTMHYKDGPLDKEKLSVLKKYLVKNNLTNTIILNGISKPSILYKRIWGRKDLFVLRRILAIAYNTFALLDTFSQSYYEPIADVLVIRSNNLESALAAIAVTQKKLYQVLDYLVFPITKIILYSVLYIQLTNEKSISYICQTTLFYWGILRLTEEILHVYFLNLITIPFMENHLSIFKGTMRHIYYKCIVRVLIPLLTVIMSIINSIYLNCYLMTILCLVDFLRWVFWPFAPSIFDVIKNQSFQKYLLKTKQPLEKILTIFTYFFGAPQILSLRLIFLVPIVACFYPALLFYLCRWKEHNPFFFLGYFSVYVLPSISIYAFYIVAFAEEYVLNVVMSVLVFLFMGVAYIDLEFFYRMSVIVLISEWPIVIVENEIRDLDFIKNFIFNSREYTSKDKAFFEEQNLLYQAILNLKEENGKIINDLQEALNDIFLNPKEEEKEEDTLKTLLGSVYVLEKFSQIHPIENKDIYTFLFSDKKGPLLENTIDESVEQMDIGIIPKEINNLIREYTYLDKGMAWGGFGEYKVKYPKKSLFIVGMFFALHLVAYLLGCKREYSLMKKKQHAKKKKITHAVL